jgi:chromosome segregation ATPase
MKLTTVILTLVSCALAAALVAVHYTKSSQLKQSRAEYTKANTLVDEARLKLEDSGKLAEVLQSQLAARSLAMEKLSNELVTAKADLGVANTQLTQRLERITQLDKQVAQLETQRDDLSKRMADLNGQIDTLEGQIDGTKKKLAMAEGDRTYLLAELDRLQNQKAALLTQFNSLADLRRQIAKLKEEAAIKQRLEWTRTGVYARQNQKGAERLFARSQPPITAPNDRLIIEIERQGKGRATVPAAAAESSAQ